MSSTFESMIADLEIISKHSHYQALHPILCSLFKVPESYQPRKMLERERAEFVKKHLSLQGKRVVDIGANSGYFTLAAVEDGAARVEAIEGNAKHASFLSNCVEALGLSERVFVTSRYVNFVPYDIGATDVVLCYNVLHHLGGDFRVGLEKVDAMRVIAEALRQIVLNSASIVFQIGYNWQGNSKLPLTENGTKREIMDFVTSSLSGLDVSVICGCYDTEVGAYVEASDTNLGRFDALGEFANRPLFVISHRRGMTA